MASVWKRDNVSLICTNSLYDLQFKCSQFSSKNGDLNPDTSDFKGFCSQASKPKSDRDNLLEKILEKLQLISIVDVSKLISTPSGVLFDAAMSGNVEFLAKFLRTFPGLIWARNERKRSVFHIAIIYRQENVFNLIYNIGAVKDYLVGSKDSNGNNMRRLAGMLPNHDQERLGAPRANLQMQRELLWFKVVGKIARPYQKFAKNKAGKTPREVFIATHKELLKGGERAIKGTASSCMLVATLIAAVVFNAALTVPGASNNEIPLKMEFEKSLHVRLMFGLTSVSITAMLLVFIAAMFLIFDFKLEWLPYLVVSLACGPVALFLGLHFDLWADLICSYYWSKFLFQPSEHRIFE
ncbi:uncharacterized protein LOC122296947 [Carya illinoinensis]|uniref:uncharacterized protein LOC122296947 n=1 Tax=Carya illinoinensis TaxID=32201 RepID=UPI001C71A4C7|nr:uncharacterized protein LOC122296947 [Carya illinoinensis]